MRLRTSVFLGLALAFGMVRAARLPALEAARSSLPTLYDEEIPTKTDSIIYVLSTSGSMSAPASSGGTSRLEQAKRELSGSIAALPETYAFNVVAFGCSPRRWSASKQKAEPGPKASAIAWVKGLQAQGGSGSPAALKDALEEKDNFTLALMTDSPPSCGDSGRGAALPDGGKSLIGSGWLARQLEAIARANTQRAAIHCLSLGGGEAAQSFCRDVAAGSGGRYIAVP